MDSVKVTATIIANAAELVRLHQAIHRTLTRRDESPERRDEWTAACAEFHHRQDALSFPGGYADALEKISNGDPLALEAAICFLEVRPYFFRSGYMYKDIFRRCKKAPLSESQADRFAVVAEKLAEWKSGKRKKALVRSLSQ